MLKDEDAVFCKQVVVKDEVGYLRKVLKGVRRIGEDEVELQVATLQELEHIAGDQITSLVTQFLQTLTDEAGMVAVFLHTYHLLATAREQFKRNAACARKEIQSCGILEIYVASYYIEYVLLGKIRCRSCLESTWHVKVTAFELSGYYAHLMNVFDEFGEYLLEVVHEKDFACKMELVF